jgi:hypothetical protein
MTIRRIIRDRRLTDDEAAKYDAVRRQIASELPELIRRHLERMAKKDEHEARDDDNQ